MSNETKLIGQLFQDFRDVWDGDKRTAAFWKAMKSYFNGCYKVGKDTEQKRIVAIANAEIDKLGRVLKKTDPHKSKLDKEDWLMNRARQVELEWLVRQLLRRGKLRRGKL